MNNPIAILYAILVLSAFGAAIGFLMPKALDLFDRFSGNSDSDHRHVSGRNSSNYRAHHPIDITPEDRGALGQRYDGGEMFAHLYED